MGGTSFDNSDYKNTLKAYFDHNVYSFSGAKSLVMLKEYNRLLLDDKGEILPFNQFKQRVLQLDELYNKTYLNAEYDSAIASAQMAEKWQGLTNFKQLEYRTVGDDRVRPAHALLDGFIALSTDPVWNKIYPPNGWHCRCDVIPAADSDTPTDREHLDNLVKATDLPTYWRKNVGKEKVIYKDDHPYYKNLGNNKQRELDAEKNYGLPSGEKIYRTVNLPEYTQAKSKDEANEWWTKTAAGQRKSIDVLAKDGITVSMDNRFRNHVLEENKDNRYRFLPQLPDILKKPDEVWSNKLKGSIQTVYIKYYKNCPIAIVTDSKNNVTAITAYEVQRNGRTNFTALANMRKGILKYKK